MFGHKIIIIIKNKPSWSERSQDRKYGNGSWAALADDSARRRCHLCRARDGQMWLWNLVRLMGVDWILPPFSFTASFTHTQTELQCYSERVSCLNPRTESEKERKAERGRKEEKEGARGIKERERGWLQGGLQNAYYSLSHAHTKAFFFFFLQFQILPLQLVQQQLIYSLD